MKGETEFNAMLGRGFKPLSPRLLAYKTIDKVHAGIPDFLLVRDGVMAGLECKFVGSWPADSRRFLLHVFGGPQITYLKRIQLAGGRAWGLVGLGAERTMYLIPLADIPEGGNWSTHQFRESCTMLSFSFDDAAGLIQTIYKG